MGGYGSGRWRGHMRKVMVEECLVLDAAELAREGVIGRHGASASTLEWEYPSAEESVISVGYAIELAEDGQLLIDMSVAYRFERGDWSKPGAFLQV